MTPSAFPPCSWSSSTPPESLIRMTGPSRSISSTSSRVVDTATLRPSTHTAGRICKIVTANPSHAGAGECGGKGGIDGGKGGDGTRMQLPSSAWASVRAVAFVKGGVDVEIWCVRIGTPGNHAGAVVLVGAREIVESVRLSASRDDGDALATVHGTLIVVQHARVGAASIKTAPIINIRCRAIIGRFRVGAPWNFEA
eukprot:scaffold2475_cov29-Tisochrysis_lutea.AAC.1